MNIDYLEQAAGAATPGPWGLYGLRGREGYQRLGVGRGQGEAWSSVGICIPYLEDDATFVALANPQRIRALVGVYRAVTAMRPWHLLGDEDIAAIRAAVEAVEAL